MKTTTLKKPMRFVAPNLKAFMVFFGTDNKVSSVHAIKKDGELSKPLPKTHYAAEFAFSHF
jgi:hypothetical protein